MAGHDHDGSHLDDITARVMALETVLTEKGLVDPTALDLIVETYETRVGPRNGARAWRYPDFAAWQAEDATAAIASLGFADRQGEHMNAVFNAPGRHNVVVCTLCFCYPWSVLGLPPAWYKSAASRARVVMEPRAVLAEFGVHPPPEAQVRVWDLTAEARYLVIPEGIEDMPEDRLADLVSRDAIIGTALAQSPGP